MNKAKRKKIIFGTSITIILVVISGVSALMLTGNIDLTIPGSIDDNNVIYSKNPYDSSINHSLFEPSSLNRTIDKYAVNPVWNPLTKDYRPRWKGCTDEEFKQIFKELPKMPQDFYKKYKMFLEGKLTDYDRLEPEYWMQPEFYGLDTDFFHAYMNRNPTMWRLGQISCMPGFRTVEMKRGATVDISTFMHTSILGSEVYLGGIVYAFFPDKAVNLKGETIFEQPKDAERYIHACITSPDNDPLYTSEDFQNHIKGLYTNVNPENRILLWSPTYQLFDVEGKKVIKGFDKDWVKKITIEVAVDKNCPSGNYVVALNLTNPSKEIVQEYNWQISSSPYYSFFYPAIREYRPIAPYFQLLITVV